MNQHNGGYPTKAKSLRSSYLCGLLIFLAFGVCYAHQAQRGSEDSNDRFDADVNNLIGRAALSLGDKHFIETETMPGLLRLWNERRTLGAGNFDLSNAFLFVMEENPEAFFSTMAAHPDTFADWLKELPDLSFTWVNDPPCQLDRKRKQLILILEHTEIRDLKASRLKEQMLARLSMIRCRQIE